LEHFLLLGNSPFTAMDGSKSYSDTTEVGESDIPVPDEKSAEQAATFLRKLIADSQRSHATTDEP